MRVAAEWDAEQRRNKNPPTHTFAQHVRPDSVTAEPLLPSLVLIDHTPELSRDMDLPSAQVSFTGRGPSASSAM